MIDRLYVVVRSDISPGLQCAQAVHAAMAWTARFAQDPPENVVVLAVPGAGDVAELRERARDHAIMAELFCEPDLGGEPTAVALGAGARALVRELPLALRAA